MQFVADMNQLTVNAAQTPELSALGSVLNGCLGLKIYTSLEELKNISSGFTVFKPSMDPQYASKLFSGWELAVEQVLYQKK